MVWLHFCVHTVLELLWLGFQVKARDVLRQQHPMLNLYQQTGTQMIHTIDSVVFVCLIFAARFMEDWVNPLYWTVSVRDVVDSCA